MLVDRDHGSMISQDRAVADPFAENDQLDAVLELASGSARRYLRGIRDERVLTPDVEAALSRWSDAMPEDGVRALATLTELGERAREAATRSSGPRFFHFVMGGGTPAALGADWLTSACDQPAYVWASSPFASRLEQVVVDWLGQLFELPAEFGGVLTTGATTANFVAMAAARNWWGEQQSVDVDAEGVVGLQSPMILSSGYPHPSAVQASGMLGLGRANVRRLARDRVARLDASGSCRPRTRAEPARSRSGRRSELTVARVTVRWSSVTWRWRGTWRIGWMTRRNSNGSRMCHSTSSASGHTPRAFPKRR
jgi:hypothetical protein